MSINSIIRKQYNIDSEQLATIIFLANLNDDYSIASNQSNFDKIITTHCAYIVLTKNRAYKIKRAVKYSYLDMLAISTRETLCKRELELNQPGLPDIYLEVLPVQKNTHDELCLGENGIVIEWVLVMKRFSQHRVLDTMAENGNLSIDIAKQVGLSVANYHQKLPALQTSDGFDRLNEIVEELCLELRNPELLFNGLLVEDFVQCGRNLVHTLKPLLNARARNGYVKRCHGDLHLRNLVLMDDGPHPFDALEFDERLATTDVLYDLAFVLMDLSYRKLGAQQNTVLNNYLAHCKPADLSGLKLLPLFLFCRAGIRAMTTAQSTPQGLAPSQEAIDYLHLALSYLVVQTPVLIAIGGYSGSGKSTVATKLAIKLDAILLSSDVERKAQLQVGETHQLPDSAYSAESALENYQRLINKAQLALAANQVVIVDATFLSNKQRLHIESVVSDSHVPFIGIWLDVPVDILESRIRTRRNNVSDATVDVLHKQLADQNTFNGWNIVDAGDSLESTMKQITKVTGSYEKTALA